MKELPHSSPLGSLMVGFMASIGVAPGSVTNHSATLREIAEQEAAEQADTAADEYITPLARSVWTEAEEEESKARESSTMARERMVLYGTESPVRSSSKFEEWNCSGFRSGSCRDVWTESVSGIKKEVSGVSHDDIESDIGITSSGEGGQSQ